MFVLYRQGSPILTEAKRRRDEKEANGSQETENREPEQILKEREDVAKEVYAYFYPMAEEEIIDQAQWILQVFWAEALHTSAETRETSCGKAMDNNAEKKKSKTQSTLVNGH